MKQAYSVELDGPPFVINPRLTSEEVAAAFEACFRRVTEWPDRVSRCHTILVDLGNAGRTSALSRAGMAIAQAIDDGVGADDRLPYHNRQHFCEVMLSAHYVALLGGFDEGERAELLLAALIHDFGHDGTSNGDEPFRLERRALDLARPYLQRARIGLDVLGRLAAAVLATEVMVGLPRARAWYRFHFLGHEAPHEPEPAPEFTLYSVQPRVVRLAVALAEADAIPSVGLSPASADLQQARLALEWGRPLGPDDSRHYLDNVFGEFLVARFFAPNFEVIRRRV